MKIAWPPTLLLICLIGTGFHCQQKLHADVGENINPIGVGWNECCLEIVRDAQACGDERLAAYIENWPLPDELGPIQCQIVASIDKNLLKPAWLEKASEHVWTDFVHLRQQRALYFFERAKDEIQKQKRIHPRDGMQSSNDSMRLLVRVLREDPDHAMSRRALGYVRHGDQWVWPNVARQLTQKKEYSPDEGWLRNGKNTIQTSTQDLFPPSGRSRNTAFRHNPEAVSFRPLAHPVDRRASSCSRSRKTARADSFHLAAGLPRFCTDSSRAKSQNRGTRKTSPNKFIQGNLACKS